MKIIYESVDGQKFEDQAACEAHELQLKEEGKGKVMEALQLFFGKAETGNLLDAGTLDYVCGALLERFPAFLNSPGTQLFALHGIDALLSIPQSAVPAAEPKRRTTTSRRSSKAAKDPLANVDPDHPQLDLKSAPVVTPPPAIDTTKAPPPPPPGVVLAPQA